MPVTDLTVRTSCGGLYFDLLTGMVSHQNYSLFDDGPGLPEGFACYPAFITEQEEDHLLETIARIDLHPMLFQGFEAKRKVAGFGYYYHFDSRKLSPGKEIPAGFHALIRKVADFIALPPACFAELLVTEYPVGSVINWHRDAPPFDLVAGVSLLSDCTFRLRPHDKTLQKRSNVVSFPVQRRSLYLLQGPARSQWQHSITPVKATRYSITLRTLKPNV